MFISNVVVRDMSTCSVQDNDAALTCRLMSEMHFKSD